MKYYIEELKIVLLNGCVEFDLLKTSFTKDSSFFFLLFFREISFLRQTQTKNDPKLHFLNCAIKAIACDWPALTLSKVESL